MKPRRTIRAFAASACLVALLSANTASADFTSLRASWMAQNAGPVYAELVGRWWQYWLGLPPEQDPTFLPDGPIDCGLNQRGLIWFIPSPASFEPRFFSCEVKSRPLFFPILTQIIFNSIVFPPDFFVTLEEKREILDFNDDFLCGRAWLDGELISRTHPTIINQSSTFTYNSGFMGGPDIFGFLPGEVTDTEAVAGGRHVLLPPLSPGLHTLRIVGGLSCDPDTLEPAVLILDNTYELTVVKRRRWSW